MEARVCLECREECGCYPPMGGALMFHAGQFVGHLEPEKPDTGSLGQRHQP